MDIRTNALCALALFIPFIAHAADQDGVAGHDQVRAQNVAGEVARIAVERDLWPGFELMDIPLAVHDGSHTWLFRHPSTPEGFSPAEDGDPPALVYPGRHPAVVANSYAEIGGVLSATVLLDNPGPDATTLAAIAIHEAFHVHQRTHHPGWVGNEVDLFLYPVTDPQLLAWRRLETAALGRALAAEGQADAACWAVRALALRDQRFEAMADTFPTYERLTELNEGLAHYVEILARGDDSVAVPDAGFAAQAVRTRAYASGAALAFLLDRFQPDWQHALARNDTRFLDDMLRAALSEQTSANCQFAETGITGITDQARRDAEGLVARRADLHHAFGQRPGWRVVVRAADGQPLWPQGFDPLNVEMLEDGLILHTRLLRLGNDAGQLEMLREGEGEVGALTEAAGPHPLFNGIRHLEVAGLSQPEVALEEGQVTIQAAGFSLRFDHAEVETRDGVVTVLLAAP